MAVFLAKTEPHEYSVDDLKKDHQALWDGVTNPVAVKHLKSMEKGDLVIIYHSGKDPGLAGLSKVIEVAIPSPKNPRSWEPKLEYVETFTIPVSLKEIKESHLFDDWALVRQGRLSTMPVPESFLTWLKKKGIHFPT